MKHIKLFEEFLNENVYQLTGMYGAKGITGKVAFAFKKVVERIKYEGDADATLEELNDAWTKWADKDGAKIIKQEVMKVIKDEEAVVYIVATLGKTSFEADDKTMEKTQYSKARGGAILLSGWKDTDKLGSIITDGNNEEYTILLERDMYAGKDKNYIGRSVNLPRSYEPKSLYLKSYLVKKVNNQNPLLRDLSKLTFNEKQQIAHQTFEIYAKNSPGRSDLLVRIPSDFVINIGFAADADGSKFSRKLDGMMNDALMTGRETEVFGTYDSTVYRNNIEIRSSIFLTIDAR